MNMRSYLALSRRVEFVQLALLRARMVIIWPRSAQQRRVQCVHLALRAGMVIIRPRSAQQRRIEFVQGAEHAIWAIIEIWAKHVMGVQISGVDLVQIVLRDTSLVQPPNSRATAAVPAMQCAKCATMVVAQLVNIIFLVPDYQTQTLPYCV